MDIVDKSGAWYSFAGERLGQGRENAKQYLKEHTEISNTIEQKIREASNLTASVDAPSASELEKEAKEEEALFAEE